MIKRYAVVLFLFAISINSFAQGSLFDAVKKNDTLAVRKILKENNSLVSAVEGSFTPLHFAARDGFTAIARILIENGAKLDELGKAQDGLYTPLMLAMRNDQIGAMCLLLEKGASKKYINEQGISAETFAKRSNNLWFPLALANPEATGLKYNAFLYALDRRYEDLKAEIDKYGLKAVDNYPDQWTLLHFAARDGNLQFTEYLVKKSADINARNNKGSTPLVIATINNHTQVCDYLVRAGTDLTIKDFDGKNAIDWANTLGSANLAEILVDPDKGMVTYQKDLLLFSAVKNNDVGAIEAALKGGANIEAIGQFHDTPLASAIVSNAYQAFNFLLKKKVNVNQAFGHPDFRETPLTYAAKYGKNDYIYLLLKNGADSLLTVPGGKKAIEKAREKNFYWSEKIIQDTAYFYNWVVDYLINNGKELDTAYLTAHFKKGGNIDYQNEGGNTLLHLAVDKKAIPLIKYFLKAGASTIVKNKSSLTPVEWTKNKYLQLYFTNPKMADMYGKFFAAAAANDSVTLDKMLNTEDALDDEMMNEQDLPILHIAIKAHANNAVSYLLNQGFDPDKRAGYYGDIALAVAGSSNNYQAFLLLIDAGAKVPQYPVSTTSPWITGYYKDKVATQQDFNNYKLLWDVAISGDSASLDTTLFGKIDVNRLNPEGYNALHLAAKNGRLPIVKLLVKHAANLDLQTKETLQTPIMLAGTGKHYDVVRFLLYEGADYKDKLDKDAKNFKSLARSDTLANKLVLEYDNYNFKKVVSDVMFKSAREGDMNIFKVYESLLEDINMLSAYGETLLYTAVIWQKDDVIDWLIKKGANVNQSSGKENYTPLMGAAKYGSLKTARKLMDKGADVTLKDANGDDAATTARKNRNILLGKFIQGDEKAGKDLEMIKAVEQKDIEAAATLLENGADPNARSMDSAGFTALHFAARGNLLDFAGRLIKAGADVNLRAVTSDQLFTPLMLATYNDHFWMADLLLRNGADPKWKNEKDSSATTIAKIKSKSVAMLFANPVKAREQYNREKLLIELVNQRNITELDSILAAGYNPNVQDAAGETPLHHAVRGKSEQIVARLIAKGAKVNINTAKYTPLMLAVLSDNFDMSALLLDHNASATLKNKQDSSAIDLAVARKRAALVGLLNGDKYIRAQIGVENAIIKGDVKGFNEKFDPAMNVNQRGEGGFTLLHFAAREGSVEIVKKLIVLNANIDAQENNGYTPLMLAARNGNWESAYLLLKNNARTDLENKEAYNAKELAKINGYRLLFEMFGNPDSVYNNLMMINAVRNNKKDDLQELLRKKVNVNFLDEKGWSALNYAAQSNRLEMVQTLLRNGADANYIAQTTTGPHSSLMLAALNNNSGILKLLLDHGAKADTVIGGQTPMQLAKDQNNYWPVEVLKGNVDGYNRYLLSVALQQAIKNDDVPSIKEAILAGATLIEPVFEEKKPLFYAIYSGSNNAATYLARITENLEEETDAGYTPLIAAVNNGNIEAAFQLIAYGAKLNYQGKTGMTAENVALKINNPLMISMLKQPAEFNRQYSLLRLIDKDDASGVGNMIKDGTPLNLDIAGDFPLIYAARKKKTAIIKILLKAGADPSVADSTGRTAMDYATVITAAEVAEIDQNIVTANASEEADESTKSYEAGEARISKIFDLEGFNAFRLLAQAGGNAVSLQVNPLAWYSNYLKNPQVNEQAFQQNVQLLTAVTVNDRKKAESLLKAGADANFYDSRGLSLLGYSIAMHRDSITNLLLDYGAKPLTYRSNLPMELAVLNGKGVLIDKLVARGFKLNEIGTNGKTLLGLLIRYADSANIQHLLNIGADPNLANLNGQRPLQAVTLLDSKEIIVNALIKAGADPNLKPIGDQRYPLSMASAAHAVLLINAKANVNATNENGEAPLHFAIKRMDVKLTEVLIKAGANLNLPARYGDKRMTPLMIAVETDRMALALLLQQAGADMNYKDSLGNSAYSIARAAKNTRMIRFLLDPEKARLDYLLRQAILDKDVKAAETYIAKGGDINLQDGEGYTPLHMLLYYNAQVDTMLNLLLRHNVGIYIANKKGSSAMDLAIESGLTEAIKIMLNGGADPNQQNAELRRPLELAVTEGKVRIAYALLQAGADKQKKTVLGESVDDIAIRKDNKLMQEVLKGSVDPDKVKLFKEWKELSDNINPVDSTYAEWLYTIRYAIDAAKKEGVTKNYDYYNLYEHYVYALAYSGYTSEALAAAEELTQMLKDNEVSNTRLRESYMLQEVLLKASGNQKKAIEQVKKAINLINENGIEKMKAYQTLANLYTDTVATEYYKLALSQVSFDAISKEIIAVKRDYAESLIDSKDSSGIKMLYQIEATINNTKIGEEYLFDVYSLILNYENEHGNKQQALHYMNKLIALPENPARFLTLGTNATALELYDKAEYYLRKAYMRPVNKLGALYHMVRMHMNNKQEAKTIATAIEFSKLLIQQTNEAFRFLSEEEKYNLLNTRKRYFDLIYSAAVQYPNNKEITGLVTDVALFTKGALIRNTAGLSVIVNENTNPVIGDLYKKWRQAKAQLETQYTLKPESRTLDIAFLEEKVREYEKNLYRYSDVKDTLYTWQKVRSTLQTGQAAIEFVTFEQYKRKWTDSVKIIAIVLTPERETPQLVELCYEDQLHKAVAKSDVEGDASYVNRLYISRGIEREVTGGQESRSVYNLIWKPLDKLITGKKQLFLSLSGSLHKLSFAALPFSKDSLLLDKYDIKYINSAANLGVNKKIEGTKNITLFGGIDYDDVLVSTTTNTTGDTILRDRSMTLNNSRGGSWQYLPGTLSETERITRLFRENKWNATLYAGKNATERKVKELTGNAPSIVHIATHGYFFPSPETGNGAADEAKANVFTAAENPLMRTGLLLAGGNTSWQKGYTTSGKDDGILTAYEVSNLNLHKTDLVVLSACETGLGDIRGSEGVYGLQRAFKIAGADKLIMSLWQVPDKETAELMQLFYSYLLVEKDYHKAFNMAQKKMRSKYPPYFWAAFILVE